jgi:hypothetical protein
MDSTPALYLVGYIFNCQPRDKGEMKNVYKILVRKPERKRPLRRPRNGWEGNIKMDLRKVGL